MSSHATWNAWFDGAAQPNPGAASIGAILRSPDGEVIEISERIGHGTNNDAEYRALIAVLEAAVAHGATHIVVQGDSLLVVNQVNGDWDARSPAMRNYCRRVKELAANIPQFSLRWVRRDDNARADSLSKKALGIADLDATGWGNQTLVGKRLGVSALAIGRQLDAAGLRAQGKATELALTSGLARLVQNHFGAKLVWHTERTAQALVSRRPPTGPSLMAATPIRRKRTEE